MESSIGSFGQVVFTVSAEMIRTLDNLSWTSRAVYADHETIEGKPTTEFTGVDLKELEFSMTLNAGLGVNPSQEAETLEEMEYRGEAHVLILGDKVYGHFTIRELQAQVTHFLRGKPIIIRVDMRLTEYDDKRAGPGTAAANREAAAGRGGSSKIPGAKPPLNQSVAVPRSSQ